MQAASRHAARVDQDTFRDVHGAVLISATVLLHDDTPAVCLITQNGEQYSHVHLSFVEAVRLKRTLEEFLIRHAADR